MKKSLIISLFTGIALLGAAVPVANAQYYSYAGTPAYTGSSMCLDLTNYLSLGSTDAQSGGQVTQLQEYLNQAGYLSGVSGTFDTGTYGAVINFQNAHGIAATGTVGPQTLSAINALSCNNGYQSAYVTPTQQYVAPSYSNGSTNNCYWSGNTYVCGYTSYPTNNYSSSNYQNYQSTPNYCGYTNGYYSCNNNGGYYYNQVSIKQLSSSVGYGGASITITGTGFSTSGNTVHFGSTTLNNVYSANGTTLSFTVPVNCPTGVSAVSVTNASGMTSNTLDFTAYAQNSNYSNNNGYNGNYYNNGGYNTNYGNTSVSLSNISGPSNVQTGTTNTWSVTATTGNSYNNNSYYNSSNATVSVNWGDNSGTNNSNTQNMYSTNGSQTYSFAHTYTYPGTYTMRVTATNSQGYTNYQTYVVTVYGNSQYYNYGYNY